MTDVVIGIAKRKRTHTLVAADELGRELAAKTVPASTEGHLAALAWADRWPARAGRWRTAGTSHARWKARWCELRLDARASAGSSRRGIATRSPDVSLGE